MLYRSNCCGTVFNPDLDSEPIVERHQGKLERLADCPACEEFCPTLSPVEVPT